MRRWPRSTSSMNLRFSRREPPGSLLFSFPDNPLFWLSAPQFKPGSAFGVRKASPKRMPDTFNGLISPTLQFGKSVSGQVLHHYITFPVSILSHEPVVCSSFPTEVCSIAKLPFLHTICVRVCAGGLIVLPKPIATLFCCPRSPSTSRGSIRPGPWLSTETSSGKLPPAISTAQCRLRVVACNIATKEQAFFGSQAQGVSITSAHLLLAHFHHGFRHGDSHHNHHHHSTSIFPGILSAVP